MTSEEKITAEGGGSLPFREFDDPGSALDAVLKREKLSVVGFGEYHQQNETAGVPSTIERFTKIFLPAMKGRASHLVVETWLSEGGCGAKEVAVVEEVDRISNRPEATEGENLTMLKVAKELGIRPGVLEMRCEDYERVHTTDGGVDYVAMLELVADRLGDSVEELLAKKLEGEKIILVFSGALHNDVSPQTDWETFSFGPRILRATGGEYVEVDILVPEIIEVSKTAREEKWFSQVVALASPKKVFLLELGEGSYLMLLKRGEGSAQ